LSTPRNGVRYAAQGQRDSYPGRQRRAASPDNFGALRIGVAAGDTRVRRVFVSKVGYTSLGDYECNMSSGVIAAGLAPGSDVYQFRTNVAGKLVLVHSVRMWAIGQGTGFTAGVFAFAMFQVRSWTANGSGGLTATLTGGNAKLRQSDPVPVISASGSGIRIADTAALTAGTRTPDAQGMRSIAGTVDTSPFAPLVSPVVDLFNDEGRYPLTLEQNTGFIITATVPATGAWIMGVSVRWQETGGYPR
jgi:hypothetical protein